MSILAQSGCFVPARAARIGMVDRLFSRVGAADDLARGRSTFMTEMIETAAILNQAGPRTFVILDEIGRGTATFDGLAIAWAAAEHLLGVNRCRALFATHYHELTELADKSPEAANVSLKAREWKGDLVFLHEVGPGSADKSYGVQVGRLAGLPAAVTSRAEDVLKILEGDSRHAALGDLPLFAPAPAAPEPARKSALQIALEDVDADGLSPREALELVYRLKCLAQEQTP
jgi:DNA mismatch repair protein MutS